MPSGQSPFIERNREIAQKVLKGEKVKYVALEYGLHPQRILQITKNVCWRENPALYSKMDLPRRGRQLAWLRKRRTYFLSQGEQREFTAHTGL